MWNIPFFDLDYDEAEREAVADVLCGRWLSSGPRIKAFEEAMEGLLGGTVTACAVANGTAALALALRLAKAGPGCEVVVAGVTFVAALNAVTISGAKPRLADCAALDDPNVNAETIARALTPETRAVLLVHYGGMPCDMDAIVSLCRERGVILIEDVAHAPGATYRGQACGSFGDFGCLSFFANKNIATGEGGLLVCRDPQQAAQARLLRSHGMTLGTIERYQGKGLSYDVLFPGFNFRLDELHAALGLVQLGKLERNAAKRARLVESYRSGLAGSPLALVWPQDDPDKVSANHLMPVLVPAGCDRRHFMKWLQNLGIQTSVHYPAFNRFSYYRGCFDGQAPVAEAYAARTLSLPLYPTMELAAVDQVCAQCQDYFRHPPTEEDGRP